MRMRSAAKLRLRVCVWPDEFTAARLEAADEGLDGLASNSLALVRAEAIVVEQVLSAHDILVTQVDEPQVRVEPGGDIALPRQSKTPGHVRSRHIRDHRKLEIRLGKQQLPGRLTARDAAPDPGEVVALLEVERARRVIGHDHLDLAGGKHGHEVVAIAGGTEGRRALSDAAQPVQVLLRIKEVVRTCLSADVDAAQLRGLDERDA